MIKKLFVFLVLMLLLSGCSSADLALSDLKENYPESFSEPLTSLSESKQEKIGLPEELPFDVSNVKSSVKKETIEVSYESKKSDQLLVRTIFQPENTVEDSDLQIPLNSGAVAGVQEKDDHVFVEWYNSKDDVMYQLEFSSSDQKKQTEQAMEIANAI